MLPKTPVDISIVVACRNEKGAIKAFLDSLLLQETGDLTWEAWIADGWSDDGTREILSEYTARHPNVFVIDNRAKIVSTGLNAAIRESRGEIILRMDAHTRYAPDYCRRCVEALLATGADNVGGPARTVADGVINRAIAAAYHSRFSTGGARFHDPTYEGWVDTVPYGCWRRSTLLKIGLFDETLVRNQDDELNLRILRAGGKIWQDPKIESWYSPRACFSTLFHQYFQYGFWKVAVIRKHGAGSWRHLVPSSFVLGNIGLALAVVAAAVGGWSSVVSLTTITWLVELALYAAASLVGAALAARRSGWDTLPYLPLAFATFHFSYGLGFLVGLYWFASARGRSLSPGSAWARLSR